MNAPSKLTFALGQDTSGNYLYADLARMPHLLVGGSTNSGKSIFLHSLITSLLYRATPREVKFVMIDPKRVELSLYAGIPHLLAPVVTNVKQAAGIFRSVLKEMEDRYDKFARLGTRNLEGYNSHVAPEERLPLIVVVVDELSDLMIQQGPEIETSICRLAQLARATGIHLIIATQRPSMDVITNTIKTNILSRMAFAVATQADSRIIINMPGAELLTGRGDMLFMPIDAAKPIRIQGCYLAERETVELVKYLRAQEEAVYTMIPTDVGDGGSVGDMEDDGSSDELFEPSVRWLVLQGQCSTSSLQRKFKISYTRAARLVEIMEARGIVGPQDGVKPREILLRPEKVDAFFGFPAPQRDVVSRIGLSSRDTKEGNRITGKNYSTYEDETQGAEDLLTQGVVYKSEKPLFRPPDSSSHTTISSKTPPPKSDNTSNPATTGTWPDELNRLIGLSSVKNDISQLANFLRFQQVRKQKGLSVPEQGLHMVFTGNPGTGKTTIARLIAQIYKSLSILSEGHFIETDRSGLVAGYLGQTAINVRKVVERALGGVLFIDEAYSLTHSESSRDEFGYEAVNTLLKLMEDHRDDLVVIVAGYTEPMQKFIRSNPGLQSRFNKFLHFDDYSPAELTEIFKRFASQSDYKLSAATEQKLNDVFTNLYTSRDETFGNGRLARNLFEKAINNHANRMVMTAAMDETSLVMLQPENIPN